jgi:hypothetical protein
MLVAWVVFPLKIVAVRSSETCEPLSGTRRHIPEHSCLQDFMYFLQEGDSDRGNVFWTFCTWGFIVFLLWELMQVRYFMLYNIQWQST